MFYYFIKSFNVFTQRNLKNKNEIIINFFYLFNDLNHGFIFIVCPMH